MRTLLLACCIATQAASAADRGSMLVERINALRSQQTDCTGQSAEAVPPLSPQPRLAEVSLDSASVLDALRGADYAASAVRSLTLQGLRDVDAAMDALRRHYCEALRSSEYSEVGVRHEGRSWQVMLARPLLADTPGDWRQSGRAILAQVNAARGSARRCGEQRFDAAPPLAWNDRLGEAAHAHSLDMATHGYVAHRGRDGSVAGERADRAGYAWSAVGENIAAAIGTPEQVVAGWLSSPSHCANAMSPDFTEMGAAHAIDHDSRAVIYWTQVLASPR